MHSPGFSKPTHGYGLPFPEASEADAAWEGQYFLEEASEPECDLCPTPCLGCEKWERNWAGKGFEKPYEES